MIRARRFRFSFLILVLILLFALLFVIYNKKFVYSFEKFTDEMRIMGYQGQWMNIPNNPQNFLSADRKILYVSNEYIIVYNYGNNLSMWVDSIGFKSDGYDYFGLKGGGHIDWNGPPHFYRKGKIIVQYIGSNEKIISDLGEILGMQFAGRK